MTVSTATLRVDADVRGAISEFAKLARAQRAISANFGGMQTGFGRFAGGIATGMTMIHPAVAAAASAVFLFKKSLDFAPQTETVKEANKALEDLGKSLKSVLATIGEEIAAVIANVARGIRFLSSEIRARFGIIGTVNLGNIDSGSGILQPSGTIRPKEELSEEELIARELREAERRAKIRLDVARKLGLDREPGGGGRGPSEITFTEEDVLRSEEAERQELIRLAGQTISGKPATLQGDIDDTLSAQQQKLQEITSLQGAAFSTLSGGIAAAVDAAVTGSDSIGKAAVKAAAMALKAIAIESTVKALESTARGLYALSNPLTAAQAGGYFTAAAKFAATAVAAGVGAAALGQSVGAFGGGGGGSGASASRGAGGGFVSPSRGGGDGGVTYNFFIGDGYIGRPKELAEEIDNRLRAGKRSGRIRDGGSVVTFS